MDCQWNLKRNSVLSGRLHRMLLLGCLLPVALGAYGCIRNVGTPPTTVVIEVVADEAASGTLREEQELLATTEVEADYIYAVSASVVESVVGSAGVGAVEGAVSGGPLMESVSFTVEYVTGSDTASATPSTFVARADGEVEIRFTYIPTDTGGSIGGVLGALRTLLFGNRYAVYSLLITEVGFDDNGTSPDEAVTLEFGEAGELTGTINTGDAGDFFVLQVQADTVYQLNLETTSSITLASGGYDRFEQINFGAPTTSGLIISASASAGVPGTTEFTAPADEEVFLRITAGSAAPSSSDAIQYAISVVEVVPEEVDE
ncbi:MAG: hypothetical protein JSU63_02695 [Phycisphaerales bacterium]|nr:MAG: hypothetical protein JSU63_02695 [Phycisphaerales bacterium]